MVGIWYLIFRDIISSLLVEKLPQHPEYKQITAADKAEGKKVNMSAK
jgi:hypothetical protein